MEHSGDECELVLTLCKHDMRKGDLLVLLWRMFVFMSVVVTVWGSVGIFVV